MINVGFNNPQLVLYDISDLTPPVGDQAFKVFAGTPDASSASVEP